MTVLITLTTAGTDVGPFLLFSDVDGYTSAFETGVTRFSLITGYTSTLVPDGTLIIRVMSNNPKCTNYVDILAMNSFCNCITFTSNNSFPGNYTYTQCSTGTPVTGIIPAFGVIQVCGSHPSVDIEAVDITSSGVCTTDGECVIATTTTTTTATPTTTTTTSHTTLTPDQSCVIDQGWCLTNLAVDTYANGDNIPLVTDPVAWAALTTGARCYPNNDISLVADYGYLYNWYAVDDIRGLVPAGYHIPSDAEFQTLYTCLGGFITAGNKMKEVGTTYWNSPNTGATNSSGFGARGGGERAGGVYGEFRDKGYYWKSDDAGGGNASGVFFDTLQTYPYDTAFPKNTGMSVRCIADAL
jgi:uncharacterized protein (TIGR02145 family)